MPQATCIDDQDTRHDRRTIERRDPGRGRPVVPMQNPFSIFGAPMSPLRMMFAPLEIALYLPAYAIDTLNSHDVDRSRR